MFADDSTSDCITDTYEEAFKRVQEILNQLHNWASKNGFSIHTTIGKTEVMFISRKKFIGPLPRFQLNEQDINVTESVKCLGITIDNKLSWSNHVSNIMKNYRSKVKKLHQMRFLNAENLREIYFKGILPTVLYAIPIWGSCSTSLINKVNEIHIKAARFICKIKKSTPDSLVIEQAHWQQISWYYKKRVACITHQLYHNDPDSTLINIKRSERELRNNMKIEQPAFTTMKYRNSFSYRAAIIWNNLADELKQKPYESFKSAIKENKCYLNQIQIDKIYNGKILRR